MLLTATGSQTVGPFSHLGLRALFTHNLVEPGSEGQLSIRGRVFDGDGIGVPDAIIEIWQADAEGRYPAPGVPRSAFSGFGRTPTDDQGGFVFNTIKPGRVTDPDGRLHAPHISVTIFMRGLLRHLNSRIYFPDGPGNAEDPVLEQVETARRPTLVARAVEGAPRVIEWDVVLQGANETVFFEY